MGTVRPSVVARSTIAALALLATLGVAGCGETKFGAEPPPAGSPSATIKPNDPGPVKITVDNATDITKRPFVKVNTGALPSTLQTTDLIQGKGPEAKATDTVLVQYVGVIGRTGQEFDSTWDNGQPAKFALSDVVPGFRDGIVGMKEGGRRQIVVPPDQGYGAQGFGSLIGPDEHLIFIVDLIKINP